MTGGVGVEDSLPVKEVLLTGLGHNNNRPMLIAFVEQDLLVYEAFTFTEASVEGHLNLRFRKVCFSTQVYNCTVIWWDVDIIYQTRGTVFHWDIQTLKIEYLSWKYMYNMQWSIFDEIQDVWIADETLSWVFDISPQSKQKLRSKQKNQIVKNVF